MSEYRIGRWLAAPPDVVWEVVSDVAHFAEVAPNLSRSEIVSGTGLGMRRRCYDLLGRGWSETCVAWEDRRRYSFRVDTKDYPYPLTHMQGTWEIEEQPQGTLLRMRFEYQLKYGLLGRWLDRILIRPAFHLVCRRIMNNWQAKIEARVRRPQPVSLKEKDHDEDDPATRAEI